MMATSRVPPPKSKVTQNFGVGLSKLPSPRLRAAATGSGKVS